MHPEAMQSTLRNAATGSMARPAQSAACQLGMLHACVPHAFQHCVVQQPFELRGCSDVLEPLPLPPHALLGGAVPAAVFLLWLLLPPALAAVTAII